MKKNGVPWQEVPDSNCERRSITLSNAPRPQSESPSRPGVGWSKIGRRRPIAACVSAFARPRGSHFPSFRRAARARYLLRSAKRGFLSKVNCLNYDSSAKGAKIGPFPRYDERSTSPSRPSSNSRRNPETYRALRRSFILPHVATLFQRRHLLNGSPITSQFPSHIAFLNRGINPDSGLSNANRPREHSRHNQSLP